MTAKLEMYRRLNNALIIAVAVSLGWITFEVNSSTKQNNPIFFLCKQEPEFIQLLLLSSLSLLQNCTFQHLSLVNTSQFELSIAQP